MPPLCRTISAVKSYLARPLQHQRAAYLLALIVILFYSREAWVSGSHYVRFLEPKFIYEYDDGRRKSFRSAQDADEYFASKQQHSAAVFTAALPVFTQFFKDAAHHGVRLGELQLRTLSQSTLGNAPLSSVADLLNKTESYPRLVKLNLNAADKNSYDINHLLVVLQKAPNQKQAQWLWDHVTELRFVTLAARETEIAAVKEDTTKSFQRGVTAVKMGKNFALSVGFPEQLRPTNASHFQAQAEALAKELWPTLQSAFQNEELLSAFFSGEPQRLISIETKLGKRPDDAELAPLFNPYGPLQDSLGIRTTIQVSKLRVTLLFVVQDEWAAAPKDPRLTSALTQWLQRVVEGPPRDGDTIGLLMKKAQDTHDPAAQRAAIDSLVKLAKEPALRTVGGQRIIDFFVKHALSDPQNKDPLRQPTIENLRWISCAERRRVYFELLKTRRMDGVMSVIAQAFADFTDDETVTALIAVAADPPVSEDSRNWARYGLQSQLACLIRAADLKNAALQERIKQALAGPEL